MTMVHYATVQVAMVLLEGYPSRYTTADNYGTYDYRDDHDTTTEMTTVLVANNTAISLSYCRDDHGGMVAP